jgi:lipopolysaccharide transport system permease protein
MNKMECHNFIHIKKSKGWQFVHLKEIKEYKDLIFLLARRDITARYSQSILGALWAFLQPFMQMVVFSLVLGKFGKLPSDGVPYPIFSFAALVPWNYFSNAISVANTSLVNNRSLLSKVYFPRLIIPLTPLLSGLVDFAIAFTTLIGMMLYYGYYPSLSMVIIPFLLLLMMFTAYGVGTLLAALNTKYRDFRQIAGFIVQLWMFISPVVFATSMVPDKYRLIFMLNPLAGIIECFRWALLGSVPFPAQMLICSVIISLVLFFVGISYFKQMERFFADII